MAPSRPGTWPEKAACNCFSSMEHPFFHAGINATYYNRVCPVPSTALMLRHMLYWGCGPTDYRTGVDVMASFTNFATLIYNGGTSNSTPSPVSCWRR